MNRLAFGMIALLAALSSADLVAADSKGKETKPDGKGSLIAFVCLKENTIPETKVLESSFKKWFSLPEEAEQKVEVKKETVTFTVGKKSAVIGLMPRPIPGDDIKDASENAFLWPTAWKEMKDHKAHLIVMAVGDFKERYDRSLFISRAVAACTEAFSTTGVYWGDAATVHSPDMFRKGVVTAIKKAEDVPALLWVGFLRKKEADGSISFATKGLAEYGCMEIEIIGSQKKPSEIFDLIHGTAQYLIYEGNVIQDGDTVGDEDTKIKTRYAASVLDRKEKVIRIEY